MLDGCIDSIGSFFYSQRTEQISSAFLHMQRGNTGTWDGPAPSGAVDEDVEKQSSERLQARAQQDYVLLPGGAHLPLIGFGTYKVTSEDTIK